jgi:hypothetical protein
MQDLSHTRETLHANPKVTPSSACSLSNGDGACPPCAVEDGGCRPGSPCWGRDMRIRARCNDGMAWQACLVDAVRAALEVATLTGISTAQPTLLQETNNTVVWLRPNDIVAKVGTRPEATTGLHLEHAIASELLRQGAQIAPPVAGVPPLVHQPTGFVVTLWRHVSGHTGAEVRAAQLAESLRRLYARLDRTSLELPSFGAALARARRALDDDTFVAALPVEDRSFLRHTFDASLDQLGSRTVQRASASRRAARWQPNLDGQRHHVDRLRGRVRRAARMGPRVPVARGRRPVPRGES